MRAIMVPLAHDESATFFHYIQCHNFLPFHAHWDANNHVLNSALSTGFYELFGKSVFVLRLANVLSFLLYAWYAFRISGRLNTSTIRILTFLALVTAQFLLEFFGLARGYGLSMAFLLGTLWYLIIFFETGKNKWLCLCLLSVSLAVWANLSLMVFFLLVLCLLMYHMITSGIQKRKMPDILQLIVFVFLGVIPCYTAATYSLALKEHGALYYGTLEGFIPVTLTSLLTYQAGSAQGWLQLMIGIIFFAAILTGMYTWIKNKFLISNPFEIISFLLAGCLVGTLLLAYGLEVNFPEDRAALYFIPLFILGVSYFIQFISEKRKYLKYAAFALLFFPIQFLAHMNVSVSMLWPDQSFPKIFYDRMVEEQIQNKEQLTISCYLLHEINWAFYDLDSKKPLNSPQITGHPTTLADWQILSYDRYKEVEKNYEIVLDNADFSQVLAKRKTALKKTLLVEREKSAMPSSAQEFLGIYDAPADSIPTENMLLKIRVELSSNEEPFQAQFVISAKDTAGNNVIYDYTKLHWIKSKWNGKAYSFSKCINALPPGTKSFGVYLWNIEKKQMEIKSLKFSLYSLTE